jgi:hypothetical protein
MVYTWYIPTKYLFGVPDVRPSSRPQHIPTLAPRSGRWCLRLDFQPAFEAHPARPALSGSTAHSACLQPASPVTLPTAPQPARTAPPVVESLSFLHHAPSPDAHRVFARRTGRPQRPAAVGRAGLFRFRKERRFLIINKKILNQVNCNGNT